MLSQLKDYGVAASYFRQLAPFYANTKWSALERAMLDKYALCLMQLKQHDDYVRISLKILAKVIKVNAIVERKTQHYKIMRDSKLCLDDGSSYLNSALAASELCTIEFPTSLKDYFGNVQLEKDIRHFPDQDGFAVHLNFQSLLPEEFTAQSVQVRLLPLKAEHRSDLWLSSEGAQPIKPGSARVCLRSNVRIHELIHYTLWY